jgi:hypothetical protein
VLLYALSSPIHDDVESAGESTYITSLNIRFAINITPSYSQAIKYLRLCPFFQNPYQPNVDFAGALYIEAGDKDCLAKRSKSER